MTSIALVTALGVSIGIGSFGMIGKSRQAEAQNPVETATLAAIEPLAAQGPLAARLLTATEFAETLDIQVREGTLKPRSTLTGLMDELGANRSDANSALNALYDAELVDPRRVRAGMSVQAHFEGEGEEAVLTALSLTPETGRHLMVKRDSEGDYHPVEMSAKLISVPKRVKARIDSSLYNAALAAGAHDQQVVDFAEVFAYDVDFQREIQPGDEFEIVYEMWQDERGREVRSGDILYASFKGRGVDKSFYKFTPSDTDETDYYTEEGQSATRFLMKTPINGARLSSNFGMRRHPISGYSRLHKGTDFAAPSGTPIYAAGSGTIERASRYGGYGNYVRIQHVNGYETAYAHMLRYGPGVKSGARIKQGDIVGYVGSTGASTGPHLHYEVLIDGKHVNAMGLDLPTGRRLEDAPAMLAEFEAYRDSIDAFRENYGDEDARGVAMASLRTSSATAP